MTIRMMVMAAVKRMVVIIMERPLVFMLLNYMYPRFQGSWNMTPGDSITKNSTGISTTARSAINVLISYRMISKHKHNFFPLDFGRRLRLYLIRQYRTEYAGFKM